ncbi:hypothetical protein A7Q10_05090 [Methylacidiphilum caldifontis]|uniref:Uncharacterized protein n=2 Tax=Methylacidiphilum caldifontis TaxID=2795386 RepID=A0A4Y8PG47_9BACT|nr:hypothetical protein A7Q10_05090 [Methylacidiphilum caldifontis]
MMKMLELDPKPKRKMRYGLVVMAIILFLFLIQSWSHDQRIFSMTGSTEQIQKEDWVGFFLAFFVLFIWLAVGSFIYYLVRKTKKPLPDYAEFLYLQEEESEEEKLWKNER